MSVHTERDGRVLVVTLDRPDRLNALSRAMYTTLCDTLDAASADRDVRAVLVRSSSARAFTAGNDLVDFLQAPPTDDDAPVMRFLRQLVAFDKPLVAAVRGAAVGIGTTLLLHCDLAYAGESAFFEMPFVQLGLVPEAGSSLLVPGLVGHRLATELLVLGRRFDAHEAARWGFVNAVVADDDVDATARAAAARLAALPPSAVRSTKRLLRGDAAALERVVREEGRVFVQRLASPEAAEAVSAKLQKRAPDFSTFD